MTRLRGSIPLLILLAIGVVLHWPSLGGGHYSDDHLQLAMLEGRYGVERSPFDLYTFVREGTGELGRLIDRGILPWWSEPELRLGALRPLASALLAFDHAVGGGARWQHLHSLLWWAGAVLAFERLGRSLVSARAALIGAAIFAWAPIHAVPVAWIACRTALVSCTFAIVAVGFHARARSGAMVRGGTWPAALAFFAALLGGEYGLGVLAYLVAWELVHGAGGWGARARALAPASCVTLLYLATYLAGGFGAAQSGVYVDPRSADFAKLALWKLPTLVVDLWLRMPAEVALIWVLAGLGVALALLAGILGGPALVASWLLLRDHRRRATFFVLASTLALLPLLGTAPGTRLLGVPAIGASLLLGLVGDLAISRVTSEVRAGRYVWLFVPPALLVPALAHLVTAPLSTAVTTRLFKAGTQLAVEFSTGSRIDDAHVAEETLVVIDAAEQTGLIYLPFIRAEHGSPHPRRWRVLAMTPRRTYLRRLADSLIELRVDAGAVIESPVANAFRTPKVPLAKGTVIETGGLQITVADVGPAGPTHIRYKFDLGLDDPRLVLLRPTKTGYERLAPPRIGEEVAVDSVEITFAKDLAALPAR